MVYLCLLPKQRDPVYGLTPLIYISLFSAKIGMIGAMMLFYPKINSSVEPN